MKFLFIGMCPNDEGTGLEMDVEDIDTGIKDGRFAAEAILQNQVKLEGEQMDLLTHWVLEAKPGSVLDLGGCVVVCLSSDVMELRAKPHKVRYVITPKEGLEGGE
jgi:hypothetical protein